MTTIYFIKNLLVVKPSHIEYQENSKAIFYSNWNLVLNCYSHGSVVMIVFKGLVSIDMPYCCIVYSYFCSRLHGGKWSSQADWCGEDELMGKNNVEIDDLTCLPAFTLVEILLYHQAGTACHSEKIKQKNK